MFSKTATKFDEIFTVHLTLCSKCQIDGEDFVNLCGLFRKHELYTIPALMRDPKSYSYIEFNVYYMALARSSAT